MTPNDTDERDRLKREERSRSVLMGTNRQLRFGRRMFRRLPSSTRCKAVRFPVPRRLRRGDAAFYEAFRA